MVMKEQGHEFYGKIGHESGIKSYEFASKWAEKNGIHIRLKENAEACIDDDISNVAFDILAKGYGNELQVDMNEESVRIEYFRWIGSSPEEMILRSDLITVLDRIGQNLEYNFKLFTSSDCQKNGIYLRENSVSSYDAQNCFLFLGFAGRIIDSYLMDIK